MYNEVTSMVYNVAVPLRSGDLKSTLNGAFCISMYLTLYIKLLVVHPIESLRLNPNLLTCRDHLSNYSGIFYFCQYLHIGAGILLFGGDVFRF